MIAILHTTPIYRPDIACCRALQTPLGASVKYVLAFDAAHAQGVIHREQ